MPVSLDLEPSCSDLEPLASRPGPAAASDRLEGHGVGSAWTPLHYVLLKGSGSVEDTRTDAGRAAGKAHRLVAEPLVLAILKAYRGGEEVEVTDCNVGQHREISSHPRRDF